MHITGIITIVVLVVMNLAAFCLMAYDKHQAVKHKWRVPEKVLFIVTALFGGLGGCLGMYLLRHKTKHWYFALFFPILFVLQAVLVNVLIFKGIIQF